MKEKVAMALPWIIAVIFAALWWWDHSKTVPIPVVDPRVTQAEHIRDSALASAARRDIVIAKLDSLLTVQEGIQQRQDKNYAKLYSEYEKLRASVRGLNADDALLFYTTNILSDTTGH